MNNYLRSFLAILFVCAAYVQGSFAQNAAYPTTDYTGALSICISPGANIRVHIDANGTSMGDYQLSPSLSLMLQSGTNFVISATLKDAQGIDHPIDLTYKPDTLLSVYKWTGSYNGSVITIVILDPMDFQLGKKKQIK